jgi:hypothetical protein
MLRSTGIRKNERLEGAQATSPHAVLGAWRNHTLSGAAAGDAAGRGCTDRTKVGVAFGLIPAALFLKENIFSTEAYTRMS